MLLARAARPDPSVLRLRDEPDDERRREAGAPLADPTASSARLRRAVSDNQCSCPSSSSPGEPAAVGGGASASPTVAAAIAGCALPNADSVP